MDFLSFTDETPAATLPPVARVVQTDPTDPWADAPPRQPWKPTEEQLAEARSLPVWISAVRICVLPHAGTAQGTRMWTDPQRKRLQALFREFTEDRDVRLKIGNLLLGASGLTGEKFRSFNEMSEAQASALITIFWGPQHDDRPFGRDGLLPVAERHLAEILAAVEQGGPTV